MLTPQSLRISCAAVCLSSLVVQSTIAQTTRIARRDSDDLSRFLIESENRESLGRSLLGAESQFDATRVDVSLLKTMATRFARYAAQLNRQLEAEYRNNPALRGLIADSLKLRARTAMVVQDLERSTPLERIGPSIQQVDRDWRQLSYAISQLASLGADSRKTVDRLNQTGREIEAQLQLKPQVNRQELLAQIVALTADFDNLIDDLDLELGSNSQSSEVIRKARRAMQETNYLADVVVDRSSYDRIVREYQAFTRSWQTASADLSRINNRYVKRGVRRIAVGNDNLGQLLRLDQKPNRTELSQLTSGLMTDIDEFFTRMPLLLVLKVKDKHSVIDVSDRFLTACRDFEKCVEQNSPDSRLRDCYREMETASRTFFQTFEATPSKSARTFLADIRYDLSTLKSLTHSSTGNYQYQTAVDLAGKLETLTDHLSYDVNRWLQSSNVSFRDVARRDAQQLMQNARKLHNSLLSRASKDRLQAEVNAVYQDWRRVHGYLRQTPDSERQHFADLATHITDSLYDLMIPLDL